MTQEVKLRRTQCNYRSENARFLLECDFSAQYYQYYRKRLEKTRPFLEYNSRCKWDPSIPLYNLSELAGEYSNYVMGAMVDSLGSPMSSSPEDQMRANFMHSKRMRRYSKSTEESPVRMPQTSTQNMEGDAMLSPPDLVASPIQKNETPSQPTKCIVIGTIFKRMKLQPDVLEELSRGDFHVKVERYYGHFTSQDDKLVLEDTDESISLVGNINPGDLVTGVVVALLGLPIDDCSQFLVHDICFAEPNRQILYDDPESQSFSSSVERPMKLESPPVYLLVISGIGFHPDMEKRSLLTKALQKLIDFIWGASEYAEDDRSSRVSRILVIGDSLQDNRFAQDYNESEADKNDDIAYKMKKSRQVKQYSGSIQAVKHMDDFFAQLSKTIDVDVMPGGSDPSSHLLPQQPFHPCMFPKSCMFSTFNCTTNPYHAVYNDNVEVLASSGQNVDIIRQFSRLSDPIEIMKCHLRWGSSAPSAPDNLFSVPYEDEDPFVIDFIPDIYIVGCQPTYKTDIYHYSNTKSSDSLDDLKFKPTSGKHNEPSQDIIASTSHLKEYSSVKIPDQFDQFFPGRKDRTLLLSVPNFNDSLSCVLINLMNLESQLLSFV